MSNCDEDRSIFSGHFEVEIVIERAVAQVWKQYLDHASWVTSHNIEYVYGQPGTLGSITRVSFKRVEELSLPPPHHHYCKVVELIPERRSILKTYTEKEGAYGMHLSAFDDMRFFTEGDRTRLTFNLFIEAKSEAIAKDPSAAHLDVSRAGMLRNLGNLKRIVEGN